MSTLPTVDEALGGLPRGARAEAVIIVEPFGPAQARLCVTVPSSGPAAQSLFGAPGWLREMAAFRDPREATFWCLVQPQALSASTPTEPV